MNELTIGLAVALTAMLGTLLALTFFAAVIAALGRLFPSNEGTQQEAGQ